MAISQSTRKSLFVQVLILILGLLVVRPVLGQGIYVGKAQVNEQPITGDVYYQFTGGKVVIDRVWLEGDTNDFSIVGDYSGMIVNNGQLVDFVIRFAPMTRGNKTVTLKGECHLFFGNGTAEFLPTTLTGTAIASKLALDMREFDFSKPAPNADPHDLNPWTWLNHSRERRLLIRNVGDPDTVLRGTIRISSRVKPDGSSGDADQTFNFVEQNGTTPANQPIYRTVTGPLTINNLRVGQRGQTITVQFKPGLDYTNVGQNNTSGTHTLTLGFASNDPDPSAKVFSKTVNAAAKGPYPTILRRTFDLNRSVASGDYLYVNNFLSASSGADRDLNLMRFDELVVTNNGDPVPLPWDANHLGIGPRGYYLWSPMNLDSQRYGAYRLGDGYFRERTYDPAYNDPARWTQQFNPPPPLPISYSCDQIYGWTAPWIKDYLRTQDDPLVQIGSIPYAPSGYVPIGAAHYTITRRIAYAFEHSNWQWWQYISSTDDSGFKELPFDPSP